MNLPVFVPSKESIINSPMFQFMKFVSQRTGKDFLSYQELHLWTVEQNELFWKLLLEYSPIELTKEYSSLFNGDEMFLSRWFEGAELNFAQNLLRSKSSSFALVSHRENRPVLRISYADLNTYVASAADYLRNLGVGKGDRVAAVISNIPEAVILMLAVTSLGGIWSSSSPEFGESAILDRFEQITPKVLVGQRVYSYNGKLFSIENKIRNVRDKLPSVKQIIWTELYFDFAAGNSEQNIELLKDENTFGDLITHDAAELTFTQTAFNDPVYIMYSSGTTGKPKCIVHGAGGTLIQHYKELHLHSGLTEESKILFFTTCGWMMWNWLASGLMTGAEIHLYDGSPVYPETSRLWDIAESEQLTHLGISPKFLSLCREAHLNLKDTHQLENLKMILSTGAPLTENYYSFIYENIKKDIHISSISGGTDIISCFMLGNPLSPVFPGELQGPGLGMAVEVWSDSGKRVLLERGELVCVKSFPSMPVGFWGDSGNEKYRDSYFSYFYGIWRHGDYIEQALTGGFKVFGRSDTTLNPGGVRIGTAEIYRVVEEFQEISDSILASVTEQDDAKICLFLVLKPGITLDDALISRIRNRIKDSLSPRHIPSYFFQVSDIPRTINGKKVEVAVTKILNSQPISNTDSIVNQECLAEIRKIAGVLKKA
ncbi:MAG: acetoacetate--CoA ligase [Ignavibacteriales bacterium]|nr:MAG: acetoacetate--CoA ligase [Ignavibacteriales bacterium]